MIRLLIYGNWDISLVSEKPSGQLRSGRNLQGWVKINSDAAFSEDTNQGASACVVRDQQGEFRDARASWYQNGLDALYPESLACRDSLVFGVQLGLSKVALETDCLQLVQLWKKETQCSVRIIFCKRLKS